MPKSNRTHSLAIRQAKTVFLVSVILGFGFSFYHILIDLHQKQNSISEQYQFKLLQNYANASQAAYHLSPLLAEQVISTLMTDSAISKAQIIDDFGDVLAQNQRDISKQGYFTEALAKFLLPDTSNYTIELHQPNSQVVVGSLNIYVDGSNIAKTYLNRTGQLLLFDLLRDILLTSILLVFFYQKLSKPLIMLAEWVSSLQSAKSDTLPPKLHQDDELGRLAKSVYTLWQEREAATTQLNQLAYYDSLTGLANRSLLLKILNDTLMHAHNNNQTGALFYLDLDRFKTINDSLGHTIGDELIKEISIRVQSWLQNDFTAARIGGDEFAILLPNTDVKQAHQLAQQLLTLISNPFCVDNHLLYCTVSVGITTFPAANCTNIDVLRQADTALYRAKTGGKNQYIFYESEMQAQVESFLEIEKGLHEAINKGQLELYYQPQVDNNHRIFGVEALIRWNHPEKGVLPPGVFMPIAEETGQIIQIGNWIIEQACYQLANWQKQGILPNSFRRLAINISPMQFSQPMFVEHIVDSLAQAGVKGEHIELEITENLLLENIDAAIQKMAELKKHNLKTSIDDFGTGYSSLRYLKHLSVDVLKIDRSFVTQLHLDQSDQAIVDTIIMTARKLNLEVIAEGVEDTDELYALKNLGCDQFQGYLFDKPLSVSELNERFSQNAYLVPEPSNIKRLSES